MKIGDKNIDAEDDVRHLFNMLYQKRIDDKIMLQYDGKKIILKILIKE